MLTELVFALAAAPNPHVILALRSDGVSDPDLGRELSAQINERVGREEGVTVASQDELRALLEALPPQLRQCRNTSCLSELSARTAATVVSGRLSQMGGGWHLRLERVSSSSSVDSATTETVWGGRRAGLFELIDPLVDRLFTETPQDLRGTLELEGVLTGSAVTVDGAPLGEAPFQTAPELSIGARQVSVTKAGFQSASEWVVISAGRTAQVSFAQEAEETSIVSKWWFWTILGVTVVGASAGVAYAVTEASSREAGGGTVILGSRL